MDYKIIEAHWSTKQCDSHVSNDEDCTYAVVQTNNILVGIFSKWEEVVAFFS